MTYAWALLLPDGDAMAPVAIKQVHEFYRPEIWQLQLRFLFCEYVDIAKWQSGKWTLCMAGREVFSQADRFGIIRPWMGKRPWELALQPCIYVHDEQTLGDQCCSCELSVCIPLDLLRAKLLPNVPVQFLGDQATPSNQPSPTSDKATPSSDQPSPSRSEPKHSNEASQRPALGTPFALRRQGLRDSLLGPPPVLPRASAPAASCLSSQSSQPTSAQSEPRSCGQYQPGGEAEVMCTML